MPMLRRVILHPGNGPCCINWNSHIRKRRGRRSYIIPRRRPGFRSMLTMLSLIIIIIIINSSSSSNSSNSSSRQLIWLRMEIVLPCRLNSLLLLSSRDSQTRIQSRNKSCCRYSEGQLVGARDRLPLRMLLCLILAPLVAR